MKIFRLGFAILSLACIAHGATNETFEITSYFPDTGKVEIKSGAGRTNRPFSSFSSAEQQQITTWLTDREFKNSGLSVEIEKKEKTRKTEQGEVDDVLYMIALENRSEVDFKDVKITYRIFYETQDGQAGSKKVKRSVAGESRIDLSHGQLRTNQTQRVSLRDEKEITPGFGGYSFSFNTPGGSQSVSSGGYGGAPTVYMKDRLIGMYLCISKRDRNGNNIEQEFEEGRVPDKEDWAEYR
jgi:hypothetical protein